jgi:hypothetical protein
MGISRMRLHPRAHFAVALLCTATAHAQVLELEGSYWFLRTDAQVRIERLGVATDIDLKNDLNAAESNFPEGRATLRLGNHRLRFAYVPMHYEGDNQVSRTIIFNGRTYTFGTRILSNIDLDWLRLSWTYFVYRPAGGRVRIGPTLEAHGFLQNFELRAPTLNLAQSNGLSVGAPAVGLAAEGDAGKFFRLSAELAGISVGRYGYLLRGEGAVQFVPVRYLGFSAGYRWLRLHADYQPRLRPAAGPRTVCWSELSFLRRRSWKKTSNRQRTRSFAFPRPRRPPLTHFPQMEIRNRPAMFRVTSRGNPSWKRNRMSRRPGVESELQIVWTPCTRYCSLACLRLCFWFFRAVPATSLLQTLRPYKLLWIR